MGAEGNINSEFRLEEILEIETLNNECGAFKNKVSNYLDNKYGTNSPWREDSWKISNGLWTMHPECILSVCIPVAWHQEWWHIYQSLLSYINQSLRPEKFEINLLMNTPAPRNEDEEKKYDFTKTFSEFWRFLRDFPHIKVNATYKSLSQSKQDIWYIRGILVDWTLLRIWKTWDRHIIVSNDADQVFIHPKYLENIVRQLQNEDIEIIWWKTDEDDITHLNHPSYFLRSRAQRFLCWKGINTSGANSAFRVWPYIKVGWYRHMDWICGEDVDLGDRITESAFDKKDKWYKQGTWVLRVVTHGRRMIDLITKHGEIPGRHAWEDTDENSDSEVQKFWPDDEYRGINPEPNFSILEHALSSDENFKRFLKISLKQILKWINFDIRNFIPEERTEILNLLADHWPNNTYMTNERWEYINEMFKIALDRISENDELEDVIVEIWKLWNQWKNILMMQIDKEMLSSEIRRALLFLWIEDLFGHILIQQFPIKFTIIVEIVRAEKMRKWLEKFLKRMKEKYQQEKQPG